MPNKRKQRSGPSNNIGNLFDWPLKRRRWKSRRRRPTALTSRPQTSRHPKTMRGTTPHPQKTIRRMSRPRRQRGGQLHPMKTIRKMSRPKRQRGNNSAPDEDHSEDVAAKDNDNSAPKGQSEMLRTRRRQRAKQRGTRRRGSGKCLGTRHSSRHGPRRQSSGQFGACRGTYQEPIEHVEALRYLSRPRLASVAAQKDNVGDDSAFEDNNAGPVERGIQRVQKGRGASRLAF